jgi:hypothetical protein
LINSKNEYFYKFKTFKLEAENQLERKIKIFGFDKGGEYSYNEMNYFLELHNIIH